MSGSRPVRAKAALAFYRFEMPGTRPPPFPRGYRVEQFTPRITRLRHPDDAAAAPLLMYLVWYLVSGGRYRIVYVRDDDGIVHTSHILTRSPSLAFMGRGDLHIGPCRTAPQHRGRGIFPATLGWIVAHCPAPQIWMFAQEDNAASNRGILRAGFVFVGWGYKRRGRYVLEDDQAA